MTQERGKLVENDRFIKLKNTEYKYEFNQAARREKLRAVADASFNREFSPEVAVAAWFMETKDCKYQWEGSGLMKAKNNSPYGGELYGIYLILRFVQEMWDGRCGFQGKIKIKCDNAMSVRDSMKKSLKMSSQQSFCSLNRSIRKHIWELNKEGLGIEIGHIKGHQDDLQRFEFLPRWSHLNIIADSKAKNRLAQHFYSKNKVRISRYHKEGWTCWLGDIKCEDFKYNQLQDWILRKKARSYWNWREYMIVTQFDIIDWDTIEKTLSRKPHGFHTWYAKHHSGWCDIGKNMKR